MDTQNLTSHSLLSEEDLVSIGVDQLGYVRPAMIKGQKMYAVYAADGKPLFAADTPELAMAAATQEGLSAGQLH